MTKRPKLAEVPLVAAPVACKVVGKSRVQFGRLVKAGIIPTAGPHRYDLAIVVPILMRYERDGRAQAGTVAGAKEKLARAQTLSIEQRTRVREGSLVERSLHDQVVRTVSTAANFAMASMATRLAVAIPDQSTSEQREFLCREEAYVANHHMASQIAPGLVEPLEFFPEEIPGAPYQNQGANFAEELRVYRDELIAEGPEYFSMRARHYARVALANALAKLKGPDAVVSQTEEPQNVEPKKT